MTALIGIVLAVWTLVVVGVLADRRLGPSARTLDTQLKGSLVRAMEQSRFSGKRDQTLSLLAPAGSDYGRILLVGLGAAEELDAVRLQGIGASIVATLAGSGHTEAFVAVDALADQVRDAELGI